MKFPKTFLKRMENDWLDSQMSRYFSLSDYSQAYTKGFLYALEIIKKSLKNHKRTARYGFKELKPPVKHYYGGQLDLMKELKDEIKEMEKS